ncbi:hypothetical protein DICVIV_12731 [Dictyocaulus viviparus]|uniref:BTB domain-containing protein n=1 Tax=Dictyocaulus viviparus TaxID=29172 RepID=A0A0D8X9N5_DICVI|nr:hypothetical protein DICVIV_12731 [Dictyocaulus viviparus]
MLTNKRKSRCFFRSKEGRRVVKLTCSTAPEYEWRLVVQLRIKTGAANATILKVVDKDVFEFYPKSHPLSVEVTNNTIGIVKFELRVLNQLIEALPTFEEGDLAIHFSKGTPIHVYRDLIGLYSPYMKFEEFFLEKCTESAEKTYVEDFPKEAFVEMLYHIYPTLRPLYRNMRDIAKAAVAFQVVPIVYALSRHLWNFNGRSSCSRWCMGSFNQTGFEPESFFGAEIYRKLVCPAILAGKQNDYGVQFIARPYVQPDFFSQESALNKANVVLIFRRTPFYVNRGIIQAHGMSKFTVTSEGYLHALFTREMEEQCVKDVLVPGEVLVALLCSLYPLGPEVPLQFLRAAIVFCHDHDWIHMKNRLEQCLLQEPPDSCDAYRDQILFAEHFGLRNMITTCIQRAEASCNAFASELIAREDFNLISSETRDLIMDRLCSGWGLEPKHVNKLATREPTSFRERQIGLTSGGAKLNGDERNTATLAEMNSDHYFGSVRELCVVKN